MSKTFASAGVSKLNGKFSLRCTNREAEVYADILNKEGHTDINILKLKSPMGKDEARKYLSGLKAFQDTAIQACLKPDAPAAGKKTEAKKDAKAKPAPKAPAKAKPKAGNAKGKGAKDKPAETADGSEVPNAETEHSDAVDAAAEMGMSQPAFMKHTQSDG
jgi:hypothetical protein